MSTETVTDRSGKSITFKCVNGKRYPLSFNENVIEEMPNIQIRSDDVIILSYPKSGTHWLFEICRVLLQGTTDIDRMAKRDHMIDFTPQNILNNLPSPRILCLHETNLTRDIYIKKPRIIYIRRNPKDVVVSLYNHYLSFNNYDGDPGSFHDFLHLFTDGNVCYNSWFDYTLHCENCLLKNKDLNIFDLSYEDIITDPISEARKLSQFLGTERSDDKFFSDVSDFCSFGKMKTRNAGLYGIPEGKPGICRKGKVGDWKNWFTVYDSEWFDDVYKIKMKSCPVKFTFNSDNSPS